ncbi:MAG: YfcE family phosphodiesterase [Pseudomonadota bacterium]|nr:YfcE family phosphodiesterase [Pseudomonadota bacterium]
MKICVVSDSHDNRQRLAAAVREARHYGAQAVLHCGDIVAPSTLHAIMPFGLPTHVIHGNNAGDTYHMSRLAHDPGSHIHYHGQDASITLDGRRIFLVHFPHYARALALTGDYDLVCSGHEHRAHVERVRTLSGTEAVWINPGTVGGIGAPATYIIGDLATMEFDIRRVPEDRTVISVPKAASGT